MTPLFSVLTPVYDPPHDVLLAMIDSVVAQTFDNWELCLVNDCSTDPVITSLLDAAARSDKRIKVMHRSENGGIIAASADALAMATGGALGGLFNALVAQCASTLVVIGRETSSWLWPVVTFTYMTVLAWLGAFATYQIGTWLGG